MPLPLFLANFLYTSRFSFKTCAYPHSVSYAKSIQLRDMQIFNKKAFTLVELLIVIGIIGILAVTLMISLNPVEAERKVRDTARIRDAQNIQSILDQALADNLTLCTSLCRSTGSSATQYNCSSNWLGINVCQYARTVPGDPQNNRNGTCIDGSGNKQSNCTMAYYVMTSGYDHEIDVRQESISNATKVANDRGDNPYMLELNSSDVSLIGATQNP